MLHFSQSPLPSVLTCTCSRLHLPSSNPFLSSLQLGRTPPISVSPESPLFPGAAIDSHVYLLIMDHLLLLGIWWEDKGCGVCSGCPLEPQSSFYNFILQNRPPGRSHWDHILSCHHLTLAEQTAASGLSSSDNLSMWTFVNYCSNFKTFIVGHWYETILELFEIYF